MERIIGKYTGAEKGPLLICLAGMHGNEPAGIEALEYLFQMLEIEPIANPEFAFRGRIVGLRGNLEAIQTGQRFLEKDLNRQFTPDNISRVRASSTAALKAEDLELKMLVETVDREVADYQPDQLVVLDLHTTTADGGIFAIATDDEISVQIGVQLHAPVITGMLNGLQGTTMHYFTTENLGVPTVAVTFEAGQHNDPLSVNRTIAAIVNCLRTIGCVQAEHVENRHDKLLQDYARYLPKVAELIRTHRIRPEDEFQMQPGYRNFQEVKKGEVLAYDRRGPIQADMNARILMPHYQKQGDDGFFLVKAVE